MTLGPNMTMEDCMDTTTIYRQKLEIESLKAELTAIKQVVGEAAEELNEAIEDREHGINEGTLTRLATQLAKLAKEGSEDGFRNLDG